MKKITIENMDGTMEEVDLVNSFDVKEGMSKVYISEVVEETPGVYKLIGITDESVWDKVKQAMKNIVQGG